MLYNGEMKPNHLLSLCFVFFLTACVGRRVTVGPMPLPATPTVTVTPLSIATAPVVPTMTEVVTEVAAATPTPSSIPFPTLTPDTPLWPTAFSSLQVVDRAGGPLHRVVVQEPYAYILSVQEILVLDLSVPATPQLVNRYPLAWGSEPREMYLAGNWLVVSLAASSESPDCGPEINVYVLDISQAPTIMPFAEETSCFILDTALAADHLYTLLMGHADNPPRLAIFDLAVGGDWAPVNEVALPEWQTESGLITRAVLAAADDQLILAQTSYEGVIQRLAEYTLSDPATPQLVNIYEADAIPEDLQALLLTAGGRTDADMLPDCCSAWEWPQSEVHSLDVYQNITYVLAEEGLQLWQLPNSGSPELLNTYPELAGTTMLLSLGEYVMMAGPNAAATHLTVHLYQRSDPAQPQSVTTSELRYRGDWVDWVQEGTGLYAAAADGIQIISLENLAAPVETAFLTTYPGVQALAVHGETLILLWWDRLELVQETAPGEWATIHTIPISDPAFHFELVDVAAALRDVAVVGERLFVLSQWGVGVFDVSDPIQPVLIKQKPLNVDGGRFFPAGAEGILLVGEEFVLGYEHLIGLDAEGELLWYERWSDERTIEDLVLGEDGLLYAAAGEDGLVVLQPIAP